VTGGTCIMRGVPELAEQIFDVPVRRGAQSGLSGLADVVQSPIYATGVGLALYGARGHGAMVPAEMHDGSLVQRVGRRMKEWVGDLF